MIKYLVDFTSLPPEFSDVDGKQENLCHFCISGCRRGKQMHLIHVTITDESGETEKIALPAPEVPQSLDKDATQPPFSAYDVSIYAADYYRQVSEQVPVFTGITSRQVFSMIPLVSDLQVPPKPIVFQNSEPGDSDR